MGRQLRASERSDFYGRLIDPTPPLPRTLADAAGPAAKTTSDHEAIESRKTTKPAPKSRTRKPKGAMFHDELQS
jgi:hypothetical protein